MRKFFTMLGGRVIFWLVSGSVASMFLAVVEVALTVFLQLFLKALGLLSVEFKGFGFLSDFEPSPLFLGLTLMSIGFIRAGSNIVVRLANTSSMHLLVARLRLLTLHDMLLSKEQKYIAVSQMNLRIGELIPKSVEFISYSFKATSWFIQIVALMLYMVYIEKTLSMIGLSGVFFIGVSSLIINKKIRRVAEKVPLEQQHLLEGIERTSRNWLLVKVLKTQEKEFGSLSKSILSYGGHIINAHFLTAIGASMPTFFGMALLMLIIYFAMGVHIVSGGVLISFLYLFLRFLQNLSAMVGDISGSVSSYPNFQLMSLQFGNSQSQSAIKSMDLISSIETSGRINYKNSHETSQKCEHKKNVAEKMGEPPSISISRVYFSYSPKSDYVIKSLNLMVQSGEHIGIVGRSGSGKSTTLGLILGLYKPNSGSIRIGDEPPDKFFARESNSVGYVGCEPFLISGTIEENLLYGSRKTHSPNDFRDALRGACVLDVIDKNNLGIKYKITENGDGLSAGQKQRISLARALLTKPKLLILDEATANLDLETEKRIIETVSKLRGLVTVLIVSHRLSTLEYVDRVFDLANDTHEQPIVDTKNHISEIEQDGLVIRGLSEPTQ